MNNAPLPALKRHAILQMPDLPPAPLPELPRAALEGATGIDAFTRLLTEHVKKNVAFYEARFGSVPAANTPHAHTAMLADRQLRLEDAAVELFLARFPDTKPAAALQVVDSAIKAGLSARPKERGDAFALDAGDWPQLFGIAPLSPAALNHGKTVDLAVTRMQELTEQLHGLLQSLKAGEPPSPASFGLARGKVKAVAGSIAEASLSMGAGGPLGTERQRLTAGSAVLDLTAKLLFDTRLADRVAVKADAREKLDPTERAFKELCESFGLLETAGLSRLMAHGGAGILIPALKPPVGQVLPEPVSGRAYDAMAFAHSVRFCASAGGFTVADIVELRRLYSVAIDHRTQAGETSRDEAGVRARQGPGDGRPDRQQQAIARAWTSEHYPELAEALFGKSA